MTTARSGPRNLAMFACVCLCLLGPTLAATGIMTNVSQLELIDLSPLMAVRTLTMGGGAPPTAMQWNWIILLGITDLAVWSMLILWTLSVRRRGHETIVKPA